MDIDHATIAWLIIAAAGLVGLPLLVRFRHRRRRQQLRRRGIKRYGH